MANPFWQGVDRRNQYDRQRRLDLLTEEMQRSNLALQQAAGRRADSALRERSTNAQALRERMGYLDRMNVLGQDTKPFSRLLEKYPQADASREVGESHRLDELLAREPAAAERPAMPDPAMRPGAEGPRVPSNRELRASNIDQAYDKFGGAAEAQRQALESLKVRLHNPSQPKTTSLDIQLRSVQAKRRQADALERGLVWDDAVKAFVRAELNPEQLVEARKTAARMRAQADLEERQIRGAYQGAGAVAPVQMGPAAAAAQLDAQGMTADQIAEQLEAMFSPEELAAFGQE